MFWLKYSWRYNRGVYSWYFRDLCITVTETTQTKWKGLLSFEGDFRQFSLHCGAVRHGEYIKIIL